MINFILNTKSKYVIMYANNIGGKAMKRIICKREQYGLQSRIVKQTGSTHSIKLQTIIVMKMEYMRNQIKE